MINDSFDPPGGPAIPTYARQVVAALPGMYLLVSPQLVVEAVSNAYFQQAGSDAGQVMGRYLWQVLGGGEKDTPIRVIEQLKAGLEGVLETGKAAQLDWPLRMPPQETAASRDGQSAGSWKLIPVPGQRGETIGMLVYVEPALIGGPPSAAGSYPQGSPPEEAFTGGPPASPPPVEWKQIKEALSDFFQELTLDMKAPIQNMEELLKLMDKRLMWQEAADQRAQQILEMLHQTIDHFKKALREMGKKAQAGPEVFLNLPPASLARVVEELLGDQQTKLTEVGARVERDFADEWINCSHKQLWLIVSTLLSNALTYSSADRALVVAISCRAIDGYHLIQVADNGKGMDAAGQRQLLEPYIYHHPFSRGTLSLLYMVKTTVESAGGRIELETRHKAGTTFSIYIPFHKPPQI